jgi:hypothetical protein
MIPLFGSIPLQGITKIGRFITQPEGASRKMLAEFLKLPEQALQRGPTVEINDDTRVGGKGRTMVLGIIDIKPHVNDTLFHRRLLWCMWLQQQNVPH